MTILSAPVYWFNFSYWRNFKNLYLSFDHVITLRVFCFTSFHTLYVYTEIWIYTNLQTKMFCVFHNDSRFLTYPSFMSFCIYNISSGDICICRIFTLRILFGITELHRRTWGRSSCAFIRTLLYIMLNVYVLVICAWYGMCGY